MNVVVNPPKIKFSFTLGPSIHYETALEGKENFRFCYMREKG